MERWEIQRCLESMSILTDTREQPSEKAEKRYKTFGCPYYRQKLEYGDYTYNFMIDDKKPLYEADSVVNAPVVIERKMSLEEISGCFTHDRKRFKAEVERAKKQGARIYLLVEDATWEKLINGKYNTRFDSKAFLASITAYTARYDFIPIFCKHEMSGRLIKEILYRELKERLESGYYG